MALRLIRKRYLVLGCLAAILLGLYLGYIHRFDSHVENAGWSVDFSYVALRCPFCVGRVHRLTFDNRPILPPSMSRGERPSLIAPVGSFEALSDEKQYRSHGVGIIEFREVGEPLTPEELARGYYDAEPGGGWPPARRPGTPAHWCLLSRGGIIRWLDPARMSEYAWATSRPADDDSAERD